MSHPADTRTREKIIRLGQQTEEKHVAQRVKEQANKSPAQRVVNEWASSPSPFQQWLGFLSQPTPGIPSAGGKGRKANPFSSWGAAGAQSSAPRPRFPSAPLCWLLGAADRSWELLLWNANTFAGLFLPLRAKTESKWGKAHDWDLLFYTVCSNRKMIWDPFENVVLIILWAE